MYRFTNLLQIIFTDEMIEHKMIVYEKMEGKFCVDSGRNESFSSLISAKNECSQDFFCKGVNDQNCDGHEFKLCIIGYEYGDASSFDSCVVYDKKGMIYSSYETFL